MSNYDYINGGVRGNEMTLPKGKEGVVSAISVLVTKRKELEQMIQGLCVASIVTAINLNDQSAIEKVLDALAPLGVGKGSKYSMFCKLLAFSGVKVETYRDPEADDTMCFKLDRSGLTERLKDSDKTTELWCKLHDVAYGDGLKKLFGAKANGASKKKSSTDEDDSTKASAVTNVPASADALSKSGFMSVIDAVASKDPERADTILSGLVELVEHAAQVEDLSSFKNLIHTSAVIGKLKKSETNPAMVELVKGLKASSK